MTLIIVKFERDLNEEFMSKVISFRNSNHLDSLLVNDWDLDKEEDLEMFKDLELMMQFQVLNIAHIEHFNNPFIPSIGEPTQLELNFLPNHLRYAFLNPSTSTLLIVVSNEFSREEEVTQSDEEVQEGYNIEHNRQ